MVEARRESDWKMFLLFNFKQILMSAQLSSQIHVWQKIDYISSSNFPHAWKELVKTLYTSPQTHRATACGVRSESKNNFRPEHSWPTWLCVPALARETWLLCRPPLLLFSQGDVLDQLKGSRVSEPAQELWAESGWKYQWSGWMSNEIYGVLCLMSN